MTTVLLRNRIHTFVVTTLLALLCAVTYPRSSAGREFTGLGQPLTEIRTLAVDVGMTGSCTPTAQNCSFEGPAGGCGSCGAAYGGEVCATYHLYFFPLPHYDFARATCSGGANVVCMPDPSALSTAADDL